MAGDRRTKAHLLAQLESITKDRDALERTNDLQKVQKRTHAFTQTREPGAADEFMECDYCANQPGAPTLCPACLQNRSLISDLQKMLDVQRGLVARNHEQISTLQRRIKKEVNAARIAERKRIAELFKPIQQLSFALARSAADLSDEAGCVGEQVSK